MTELTESGLPRVLAIAWGMDEAPAPGPKRELTHARIVEAAIELADAQGLAAVTMAKVAESLGFTTMSLYRYFSSKDELLALMQDEGVLDAELDVAEDDWRQGVGDLLAVLTGRYEAHPWLLDLPISLTNLLMPGNMRVADAALRAMRTLELSDGEKLDLLVAVSMFARSFATLSRDLTAGGPAVGSPEAVRMVQEVATAERFPDLAPLVADGTYLGLPVEGGEDGWATPDGAEQELGAESSFTLARLLDGIAAHAERSARRA